MCYIVFDSFGIPAIRELFRMICWGIAPLPDNITQEHPCDVMLQVCAIVIGNLLKLSLDFPPLLTGRESFPSSGYPSLSNNFNDSRQKLLIFLRQIFSLPANTLN